MKLNAPTQLIFMISLILIIIYAVVAIAGINIPVIGPHIKWVAIAAWGVLAAGNVLKGF